MRVAFDKFAGSLPYASALFGVYQPLIGWRSRRTTDRFEVGAKSFREEVLGFVSAKMSAEVEWRDSDGERSGNPAHFGSGIDRLGVASMSPRRRTGLHPQIDSLVARDVLATLEKDDLDADQEETWRRLVSRPALEATLAKVKKNLNAAPREVTSILVSPRGFRGSSPATMAGSPSSTAASRPAGDPIVQAATRESVAAGALAYLFESGRFDTLKELFTVSQAKADLADYLAMKDFVDPLAAFDPRTDIHLAALSPVGIVHIFRQYFFEFDTFLGPSVQHVWLSPGSTAELVEVHTRRTVVERQVERSFELTAKQEKSRVEEDEISEAIRKENQSSTKLGVATSMDAGVNLAVFTAHASVSANFGLENNERQAREQLHKQKREQSSKLSTEIKNNHKSTFKTVTDVQETSSKRYVLTNNSPDKLVNYELRRKLRQVGVQLQDLGTRLCWQVYVDNPGRDLGVAELVHIAAPADLAALKQPEAPTRLAAQTVDVPISFAYQNVSGSDEKDVTFYEGSDRESGLNHNDRIAWIRNYKADPPDHGYVLHETIDVTSLHTSTCAAVARRLTPEGEFEIKLEQVNFDGQSAVNLKVTLRWEPPDQGAAEAKFLTEQVHFDREKERLSQEAYTAAARERVKLASNIEPRPALDLREEERIVVYRKLIGALLNVGVDLENSRTRHLTAELVQAIFDVDSMLYFAAPEWWRPREQPADQTFGRVDAQGRSTQTTLITEENLMSWGGAGASGRPANYYITEDSQPAKLGSSLGWLLQLDGDNLRNAFLNAPWVKAVIPIRSGRELAAIRWLTNAAIEGTDGLSALYQTANRQEARTIVRVLKQHQWTDPADQARYGPGLPTDEITVGDALRYLGLVIAQKNADASQLREQDVDGELRSYLPADKVFEHGFDPSQGGFRAQSDKPFEVFDQWVEVLPTDQVVAVEVKYDPVTGFQVVP